MTHRGRWSAAAAGVIAGALAVGAVSPSTAALGVEPGLVEQGSGASGEQFDRASTVVGPRSSGAEALSQMDDADMETVAEHAGISAQRLHALLDEEKAVVSPSGFVALVDRWNPGSRKTASAAAAGAADVPGDPMNGSRPGAPHTVFIDFDGHTIEDTEWNNTFDVDRIEIARYDVDDDFKYAVWQRIAQDYAPFDINVTISDPGPDALDKASADDEEYGVHLVIASGGSGLPSRLREGAGWAFIAAFGSEYAGPALVLADNLDDDVDDIADAGAHEVGHTLGLDHHGIGDEEYYYAAPAEASSPDTLWGPIMGNPLRAPLSQWSDGAYADATNPDQDDITTMTERDSGRRFVLLYEHTGALWTASACFVGSDVANPQPGDEFYRPNESGTCDPLGPALVDRWEYTDRTVQVSDPHGDTASDATALDNSDGEFAVKGNIVSSADVDVFSFASGGGPFSATAAPSGDGTNLDVRLALLNRDGDVLAKSARKTAVDPAESKVLALDATIQRNLKAGVYYLTVEGRGQGDPADNTSQYGCCYSDYASLGFYELSGEAEPFEVAPITITAPDDGAEVERGGLVVTGTAEPRADVSLTISGDSVGTAEVDDAGHWVARLDSDLPFGRSTMTAQQTAAGISVPATDSVTVTVALDAPAIAKPDDGDVATTETPRFSGTGSAGATVAVSITCGEDFALRGEADGVVEDGTWSFVPGQGLPNGECTVQAAQSVGDVVSQATVPVSFGVDADDSDTRGGEGNPGTGDEGGHDLPDTGSSSALSLAVGVVLLTAGGLLFARSHLTAVLGRLRLRLRS